MDDRCNVEKWKRNIDTPYLLTIDMCSFPAFDNIHLLGTPKRSLSIRNAGGSSEISEALSMQYMHYRFNVTNFIPEMEVDYWIESKICDYLMKYKNENIGVSVTRAVSYPFTVDYTYEMASTLLNKKLYGLIVARNSISEKHMFFRSILHIWCMNSQIAHTLKQAYHDIILSDVHKTYDNVYIICTVCPHLYIYNNRLH